MVAEKVKSKREEIEAWQICDLRFKKLNSNVPVLYLIGVFFDVEKYWPQLNYINWFLAYFDVLEASNWAMIYCGDKIRSFLVLSQKWANHFSDMACCGLHSIALHGSWYWLYVHCQVFLFAFDVSGEHRKIFESFSQILSAGNQEFYLDIV